MASNDLWFPFYISDYLRDTQRLNTEQHGAYVLLLMSFWIDDGQMPDDDEQFASIVRCSLDHWKTKLRPVLIRFFQVDEQVWIHKRVKLERVRTGEISRKRSEAGRLGGRPEKQTESKPKANGIAKPKQTESISQSQSHTQVQPKAHTHSEAVRVFEKLKTEISGIWNKERRWSHLEESTLAEISRSPEAELEWSRILAYREILPIRDRLKFFPQSVGRLLQNWTEVLDRAETAQKLNASVLTEDPLTTAARKRMNEGKTA